MSQRSLHQTGLTAAKYRRKLYQNRLPLPHTTRDTTQQARLYSSHIDTTHSKDVSDKVTPASSNATSQKVLGKSYRLKEADREFFVDLLSSAATKRDAKAYISRLKSPTRRKPPVPRSGAARSKVNLGNLFGRARAVDAKPVFTQHLVEEDGFEEGEVQHIALVKLSDTDTLPDAVCVGLAQTLSQLSKLSMAPCVVLSVDTINPEQARKQLIHEGQRLSSLFDVTNERGARVLDCIFTVPEDRRLRVSLSRLLDAPLKRGQVPIVLPVAYSSSEQKIVAISPDDAILALVAELSGNPLNVQDEGGMADLLRDHSSQPDRSLVDRIIIIDRDGGLPNAASPDGKHVFLNLEQEFAGFKDSVRESQGQITPKHLSNLTLLNKALKVLPHSSSGLMTTPTEASNLTQTEHSDAGPVVGTRRQKNTLIHNLLTDRPAYSASLPKTRLARPTTNNVPPAVSTFIKRGMPVKMIPDPLTQPWNAKSPRIKLTDSSIDLERLVYLVDDSFNRKLDVERYLERVNENIAGVIIAGDYEGGAILTWESPPGIDPSDISRQVPYLDKFAVLKKSQGAGGVADIVFNAMVRTCFPNGVCWRSRKDNPVNKWYFERSAGTWKIPGMNWTMFWTTPGVTQHGRMFQDYEAVCRGIQPTWIDKTRSAD